MVIAKVIPMPRTKAEIGAPGLPLYSGRLSLDQNTRLRWPAAGRIYRTMLDDEPAVGALRQALMTLLRTDVQVQPGEKPMPSGRGRPRAEQRAADHVQFCLDAMRDPFGTKLRQLAGAWFYGFDIHELVYERRKDGTVGWRDWGIRRQETLERWETDKQGRVSAFTQRPAPDFMLRTIPLNKALHVVTDDADGSPEGRGILRTMYRYWYMKTQFELLAGIALERFGSGLAVFQRTDQTVALTPAQEDDLAEQAAALRQNEEAFLLLPWGISFQFAASPGLDADTYLNFIRSYTTWMLAVGMAEFIALGTGDTGSYALGSSKITLFLQALTGLQNRICETINRQAIPRLMALNGWNAQPQVVLPPVKEYDLNALGTFANTLAAVGAFHATPADEAWFRKISDLMDVDMEELERLHEEGKEEDQPPTPDEGIDGGALDEENEEEMVMEGEE